MHANELRFRALNIWANHIETGDVSKSAQDARNIGETPKALTAQQATLVEQLRQLAIEDLHRRPE